MAYSVRSFYRKLASAKKSERVVAPSSAMTLLPAQRAGLIFLLPAVATPQSSWLSSFGYAMRGDEYGLVIQFKDGATCFYPGTTSRQHAELDAARSKGTWVHDNLVDRYDYDLV